MWYWRCDLPLVVGQGGGCGGDRAGGYRGGSMVVVWRGGDVVLVLPGRGSIKDRVISYHL